MDVNGSSCDVSYSSEEEDAELLTRIEELEEQVSMLEVAYENIYKENCKLRELLRV